MYYHMGTSPLKRVQQEIQMHNSFPRPAPSGNRKAGICSSDDIHEIISSLQIAKSRANEWHGKQER